MKMGNVRSSWVRFGFSGLLFGGAFLHAWVWWLVFPALVLFIHASVVSKTKRGVIGGSLLAGTLKAMGAIAWFWHVYPLSWIEFPSIAQIFAIGFYWVNVSLAIGAGMIVAGLAARYLARRGRAILVLPAFIVCAEIAGSFFFSILSLGPGSTINVSFSFGYIGYLASYLPGSLGVAMFGGVYALSLYAACIACAGYLLLFPQTPEMRRWGGGIAIMLLIVAVLSGSALAIREVSPVRERIIAIETSLTAYQLTSASGSSFYDAVVRDAVTAALENEPDLLVLPEGASFARLFGSEDDTLAYHGAHSSTTVVGSTNVRRDDGSTVLQAHVFDPVRNTVHHFDKQYLVPQGEHTIYYIAGLLTLLGKGDIVEEMVRWELSSGEPYNYADVPSDIPSVLFCTESVVPTSVRGLLDERGTDLVVHLTSHGWFHRQFLLQHQLDRMLRIQAVWNGATIVEASNLSRSKMYLPDGSVTEGMLLDQGRYWKAYAYGGAV